MSDLISRQAAVDALGDAHFKNYGNAILVIKDLPSAEPKRGKWAVYENLMCVCSECGYETFLGSRYCPNCGADMMESE